MLWGTCKYCYFRPISPKGECIVAGGPVKHNNYCSEWYEYIRGGEVIPGGNTNNVIDKKERLDCLRLKKALSLPCSKQLVYYYPNAEEPIAVESITIKKVYKETDAWFELGVKLKNGEERAVHSDYFSDMQKGKRWSEKSWPDV